MKLFYVAVLLAVMQAPPPVPRKTTNDSAGTARNVQSQAKSNQEPTPQGQAIIKANEPPSPNTNGSKQGSDNAGHPISISKLPTVTVATKRDWADWGYWVFGGLLVVVGFLQVWLLRRTLGAIQRQADLMDRQTKKLEESVGVADKAAIAAHDSADAAKQNIGLLISKERARVSVEINPLKLTLPAPAHTVSYNLRVHGPADAEAYVTSSAATALVTDSQEIPTSGFLEMPMFDIPNVVTKHNPAEKRITFLQPKMTLDQGDIDNISQEKAFVHFWGFIKYRDVFDKARETYFRYIWDVSSPFYGGSGRAWIPYGSPEDNRAT